MNKKITKIAVCLLAMIVIPLVIILFIKSRQEGVTNTEESSTEPSSVVVPKWNESKSDDEEESKPAEQDRTFDFDDKIKVVITHDDYINSDSIVEEIPEKVLPYSMPVTGYSFSEGFMLCPSKNIIPAISSPTVGYANCSNLEFKITVEEKDALVTTTEKLREEYLTNKGFYEYLQSDHEPITRDAKLTLGSGLDNWESYFKDKRTIDPTIYSGIQLVADCDEECAYGAVKYVCVYDSTNEVFEAKAFITCDRDRILEITVRGNVMSLCWSYIIEATNDSIKLIT